MSSNDYIKHVITQNNWVWSDFETVQVDLLAIDIYASCRTIIKLLAELRETL